MNVEFAVFPSERDHNGSVSSSWRRCLHLWMNMQAVALQRGKNESQALAHVFLVSSLIWAEARRVAIGSGRRAHIKEKLEHCRRFKLRHWPTVPDLRGVIFSIKM